MRYDDLFQWVQLGASLAAVFGIPFAAYQLLETKRQAATSFEDQIAREYRDIARSLPLWVLLDEEVLPEEYKKALHTFHQYFELSNYQVFLRRRKRIRDDTWAEWREGILHTMRRPAFRRAWEDINHRAPDSYPELFVFEAEKGAADPKSWPEGHIEKVNRRRPRDAGPAV